MFVINAIQGEGNTYQQDRAGKLEKTTADGRSVKIMWAADGHGSRIGYQRCDMGGLVAQTGHDILNSLDADMIAQLYDNPEIGKELFANIHCNIEQAKDEFFIRNGWRKLTDADGNDIDVLWTKPGGSIVTSGGGTTLILAACVNVEGVWKARMYNVGDSMMIHNDTVYSQSGINGISEDTFRAMSAIGMKTVYSDAPGSVRSGGHLIHSISVDDTVEHHEPPTPLHGKHRYYVSDVRGSIATSLKLIYTPKMFNLMDLSGCAWGYRFNINTELASWSNMGDTQNAPWAAVPSYSDQFVITGPLSLTSDGIGDIMKSEATASLEEKTGWFNYYEDHPMHSADANKTCIFKNAWFHETVMAIDPDSATAVHDDPFYKVAKSTFGVADNICRVTFIP
tara:strand:+ start:60 stop:1244 length:1185 start_codon:yes stop_codon:yes gene_type:complete